MAKIIEDKEAASYGLHYLISGGSCLFRSADEAMKASRQCTTNPGVMEFERTGRDSLFAACGDWWIDSAGNQGRHLYGRRLGGKLRYLSVEAR